MKRAPIFPCGLDFFFCSSSAPEENGHSMHRLRREAARNLSGRQRQKLAPLLLCPEAQRDTNPDRQAA